MSDTNLNVSSDMILEIKSQYNVGYFIHLVFWLSFIIIFSTMIVMSPTIGIIFVPILIFAFYEKIILHLQRVDIQIFKDRIIINNIIYDINDISFKMVKVLFKHEKGVFINNGVKIYSIIFSSFLSPYQTSIDGDRLEKLINCLKLGQHENISSLADFSNEVKARATITIGLVIIFLIMSIPIYIIAMLLDIPFF